MSCPQRDQQILSFERLWWKYAGAKEQAIREQFAMSATRYYQVLNALIDRPEAIAFDPLLVKRLRRLRAARQRQRSARRLGLETLSHGAALGFHLGERCRRRCRRSGPRRDVGYRERRYTGPVAPRTRQPQPHGAGGGSTKAPAACASRLRMRHRGVHHAVPKALVAVYNNAGIRGLAAEKADLLQGAGWNVAAVDNWYGNIPANTVYYPPGLRRAAHRLAAFLGVHRLRPAVAPMQFDRLTVIFASQ